MWHDLKIFTEGGLYEAMLRDLNPSHPNHDWLLQESTVKIPDLCKMVLDDAIKDIVHDDWEAKGKLL